ncbi:MAG: outer membrane protein transport protein [candidate division Zixibacteria bacterium]|nr:outer membrane protein transport protein [candidate division Zixibacteria bacterium]
MNRAITIILCLISVFLYANPLMAQLESNPFAVYEMTTENNNFVGARAAGMGGAQIAAGDDGSTIWYNPALLCRIRRIELSGGLSHQRFFNNTTFDGVNANQAQLNNTRLSSVWGVFPVPVEQGGLSFALAANRIKSFDRIFRFEDKTGWLENPDGYGIGGGEDDKGGLWVYSGGMGIELSRHTAVGIALDLYGGHDNYSYIEEESTDSSSSSLRGELKDSYTGYSARVGLAFSKNPNFHFGATIKFPTSITVEQNEWPDYGKYKYTLPFSFGVGSMVVIRDLLITGDVYYTDYTQLEYSSGVDLTDANSDVKRYYKDVITWHAGVEYFIPSWGFTMRAGYARDPIPYTYFPIDNELDVLTAGFGFLLDKTLKLDFAVNLMDWTRQDPGFRGIGTIEKYEAQRAFLGITYRI